MFRSLEKKDPLPQIFENMKKKFRGEMVKFREHFGKLKKIFGRISTKVPRQFGTSFIVHGENCILMKVSKKFGKNCGYS